MILGETYAGAGKSQQEFLFLVKGLVLEKALRNLLRGKMNDSTVFPFKKFIKYFWHHPLIFKEQLFKLEQAKLQQLI